ncbi:MAG: GTP-binding protein [Candidatus Lokiarchaeota archaeon]|nr:GTP-binding protein [Candidatus Lokiarchaeota archaeon]
MSTVKVLKIIITGEGGVGKTTLLHRYIEGKFLVNTYMTIGVEFFIKELEVDDNKILLQIWDFGGQERFRFLLKNYAKGTKGALFLFDLTRPLSLENIDNWIEICRSEDPTIPILLIGSKADLEESFSLDEDFIQNMKNNYNFFDFIKISSKTGENVDNAFKIIAEKVINSIKDYRNNLY